MRLYYYRGYILVFILLFFGNSTFSQSTISINQGGSFSTCNATFTDSDANAGNYNPNENYTITICSDGSNGTNAANFSFSSFDIDPSDNLYIYDGNSTSAPLIGVYNNNNPIPNNVITSTINNTSSCITFQFISDGSSEGTGWSAIDTCVINCQPVDPSITTIPAATVYAPDSVYTTICLGDDITFNAIGTFPYQNTSPLNYAQSDASTTYEWFFGDGSSANGQTASHTYQQENGYLVWLKVTDIQGCVDYYPWKVRVGVTPSFTQVLPQNDTVCFSGANTIIGGYDPSSTSSSGFSQNQGSTVVGGIVSDTTWLPDGTGSSYTSNIEIVGYPGQSITSATDITDICMNIEHSYIGDLSMTLTCPNGTTITLMDAFHNGTGPGGTFLGDANDANEIQGDYGIGMDYCFDMNATWGTMIAENAAGNYIPSTVTPGNDILTPGSYQPEQSFTNLIGCPIDGTWTITVTDWQQWDDGYIYSWGVNLAPSISPYSETFTVGIDSTWWTPDPTITNYTSTGIDVQSTNPGTYSYTFNVMDEYGCTYDTTVSFYTLPDFLPEAGPDSLICAGNTIQFQDSVLGSFPCTYTINMSDSFGDGWNGAFIDVNVNGSLAGTASISNSGSSASFSIEVYPGDVFSLNYHSGTSDSENTYSVTNCEGTTVFSDGPSPSTGNVFSTTNTIINSHPSELSYSWSPSSGLSNPNTYNPSLTTSTSGYYYLTVGFTNFPQCGTETDSLYITVDTNNIKPSIIGDTMVCLGNETTLIASNALTYMWPDSSLSNSYTILPDTDTTIILLTTNHCFSNQTPINIIVVSPPITSSSSDTTIAIDNSVELYSSGGYSYEWQPFTGLNCNTCDTVTASPVETTTYYIEISDSIGCKSYDTVTVNVEYFPYFLPNGFSPNNDGNNDVLYIRGTGIQSVYLQVFDRYGNLMFETQDQNVGWDGTYQSKPVNTGVYIYNIQVFYKDGRTEEKNGNITLFR